MPFKASSGVVISGVTGVCGMECMEWGFFVEPCGGMQFVEGVTKTMI